MKVKEFFTRLAVLIQLSLWSLFIILVLFEFVLIVNLIAS